MSSRHNSGYGRRTSRNRGIANQGFRKKKKAEQPFTIKTVRQTKGWLNIPTGEEKEKITISQPPTSFTKEDTASGEFKIGSPTINADVSGAKKNKREIRFAEKKGTKVPKSANFV